MLKYCKYCSEPVENGFSVCTKCLEFEENRELSRREWKKGFKEEDDDEEE